MAADAAGGAGSGNDCDGGAIVAVIVFVVVAGEDRL